MKLKVHIPLAIGVLLISLGCGSPPDFDSVYTRLTSASLEATATVPDPQADIVLTVSGAIENTNAGDRLVMDIPTIEAVGQVQYTVEDPFEQTPRTFTGVLMRDLLALWQVSPAATELQVIALNDYQIDIPLELLKEYPVIFALQQDGDYMTPDYRGPAMLVFPYDHYTFDIGTDSYWVWQIERIVVK